MAIYYLERPVYTAKVRKKKWTADEVTQVLVNPAYAVRIHPDLIGGQEPLIDREQWISANLRLIDQLGAEAWLNQLLTVLRGDFPSEPHSR
jgi:hypothetical protein